MALKFKWPPVLYARDHRLQEIWSSEASVGFVLFIKMTRAALCCHTKKSDLFTDVMHIRKRGKACNATPQGCFSLNSMQYPRITKETPLAKLVKYKLKITWKQNEQGKRLAKKTQIQAPFPLALAVYIKVLFTPCPKGRITGNALTNSWNYLSLTLFLNGHTFHNHGHANWNEHTPKYSCLDFFPYRIYMSPQLLVQCISCNIAEIL